jgi:hypothetical protein
MWLKYTLLIAVWNIHLCSRLMTKILVYFSIPQWQSPRFIIKLVLHTVVRDTMSDLCAKIGQVIRCTQVESTFLVVTNRTRNTQHENRLDSFLLRPDCDNLHAWSTLRVRKLKVLRKFDRQSVTQANHTDIPGYFPHEGKFTTQEAPTFHLLSMYLLTKRGKRSSSVRITYFQSTWWILLSYLWSTSHPDDACVQRDKRASEVRT